MIHCLTMVHHWLCVTSWKFYATSWKFYGSSLKRPTFKRHDRCLASFSSQKLGIMRKPYRCLAKSVSANCFSRHILPVLEHCALVWLSSAASHLASLTVFSPARFLCGGDVTRDLAHSLSASKACTLHKITANPFHLLHAYVPDSFRNTRLSSNAHNLLTADQTQHLSV